MGGFEVAARQGLVMSDTNSKTISATVEIERSPEEVFGYVADPAHLPEWQSDVRHAAFDDPAGIRVGARGHEVRHVMGSDRSISWEITDYTPNERYGLRGVDGPVRAHIMLGVTPSGRGTRLDYGIAFEGHGVGKLIAPMARKGAAKDLPATLERLKQTLEGAPV